MARAVRPLVQWQWPRLHQQCCCCSTLQHHLLDSAPLPLPLSTYDNSRQRRRIIFGGSLTPSHRSFHFRSRGLRLPESAPPSDTTESDSDADPKAKKSRNEKKREARRAVRWGMDLASFSTPQIKRILSVASLDEDVFDALMLVKRMGRDVREGKRRQFNYIGRLLREAQPELMDGLIQATKDGDQRRFQALSGSEALIVGDNEEVHEETETEYDVEEEGSDEYVNIATRWFDGLMNKDSEITNEVFSVRDVEYDRQELSKLVRKVYSIQENQVTSEENEGQVDVALEGARKALSRFLRTLAEQLPTEASQF